MVNSQWLKTMMMGLIPFIFFSVENCGNIFFSGFPGKWREAPAKNAISRGIHHGVFHNPTRQTFVYTHVYLHTLRASTRPIILLFKISIHRDGENCLNFCWKDFRWTKYEKNLFWISNCREQRFAFDKTGNTLCFCCFCYPI